MTDWIEDGVRRAVIGVACLVIAGCSLEHGPPSALREIPREQWPEAAMRLPLQDRLDLHAELYGRAQHPRDLTLIIAFRSEPIATFDAIEARTNSRRNFYTYVWILIELDTAGLIDLCGPQYRERLVKMAQRSDVKSDELANIGLQACVG